MERYLPLTNATSLINAVKIINNDATERDEAYTSDYLAAQYAFEAALDGGYGLSEDVLGAHLSYIFDEGAIFRMDESQKLAEQFAAAASEQEKIMASYMLDLKYLMNPHSGTVQTAEQWQADGYNQDNVELVEVVMNDAGEWEEA